MDNVEALRIVWAVNSALLSKSMLEIASFILAVFGTVLGLAAVCLAMRIAKRQKKEIDDLGDLSKKIDAKLFGTLDGPQKVHDRVIAMLKEAHETGADVYLMLYWLWFGADLQYDGEDWFKKINSGTCMLWKLLEQRLHDLRMLKTTVVTYSPADHNDALRSFVEALGNWHDTNLDHKEIDALLERYAKEVGTLSEHYKKNENFKVRKLLEQEVPMILFAVSSRSRQNHSGVIFLAETSALEKGAKAGGFYTQDPAMVEIMIDQIEAITDRVKSGE